MLDQGVRPGIQDGLVTAVAPTDDIRGQALRAPDLDHFTIPIGFADSMASNDDPISDTRLHELSSFSVMIPRATLVGYGRKALLGGRWGVGELVAAGVWLFGASVAIASHVPDSPGVRPRHNRERG